MITLSRIRLFLLLSIAGMLSVPMSVTRADEPLPKATIDGTGLGWRPLEEKDFVNVNTAKDTWSWKDGIIHCTGKPTGVMRTTKPFTNFELVAQWEHLSPGGNSGIFVWADEKALAAAKPGVLPQKGFEVQVLDHAFIQQYEKSTGKKAEWFTTNGDVFPLQGASMKPFPPVAPDKQRSFPRKNLSKGVGQWNHYYVRAINGEIRLWVNGEEVSGGTNCEPRSGYLCLESEGAPVEFKEIRIRELP
jgi:hypothetical protein